MDAGFIFQDPKIIENIKISNYVPDQVPSTKDNLGYSVIYNVEIDADHFRSVTYVRFQKIQEALATMGGIISIMKLFFTMILMGIYRFSFPFVLFREVYLQGEEKIKLDKNRNQQNLLNLQNIKIQNRNIDKNNNFKSPNTKSKNFLNLKRLETKKNINNLNNENFNWNVNNDNDVIIKNIQVIKLDKPKNDIFGSEFKRKENYENASNDIIKTDINCYKEKNNIILQRDRNADLCENQNKLQNMHQTFNNVPDLHDKRNYFNEDVNQVSKSNRNRELINNDNFKSSKRKLNNDPSSRDNTDIDSRKKLEKDYIENKIYDNEEDNSNNKIILTKTNKDFDILNSKKNQIDILTENLNKKRKAFDDKELLTEIKTNKHSIFGSKIPEMNKVENNEPIRNNRNKYVFSINLPELVFSICCRRRHIHEPLKIILEKIDREIEIKSYLRIKEDFLIMKEILFDAKDREIFNNPYDFEEIYYSVKETSVNEKNENIMSNFWKKSFNVGPNKAKNSNRRASKVATKFSEKFKSLGEHIKKIIK